MKRQVTLRLDEKMYKELRIFLIQKDMSFQKYIETLIENDFKYYQGMKEETKKEGK